MLLSTVHLLPISFSARSSHPEPHLGTLFPTSKLIALRPENAMEHQKDGHTIIYPRSRVHIEYQGFQWYLRAFLALTLLTLCFLIAGLTLGVCGLDPTWLQMRGITGTAKQRYDRVHACDIRTDSCVGIRFALLHR